MMPAAVSTVTLQRPFRARVLPSLTGNTRFKVGGTVVGFIAQQLGFGVAGAHPTRRRLPLGPPGRLAAPLVGGRGAHGSCWFRSHLLTSYLQRRDCAGELLAQAIG